MARVARYIVKKAPHVGGNPIPEDEPCLVVRAQDKLAVDVLRYYIDEYNEEIDADPKVIEELEEHLNHLILWQMSHPTKIADR